MKIADYAKVKELKKNNILLLDGPDGTKTILVSDLVTALIGLLNDEGFVSGIDMAELDKAETVLTDNIFLIGTDGGNKSVDAETLAKKLVGMLTSEELVDGLTLSELDKTVTLEDEDYMLAGTTAGTRAMTAKDLAKALIEKLTTVELTNGMKLSELVSTGSLTATDNVLVGTSAGNQVITAQDLAKALIGILTSEEFISGLEMDDLAKETTLGSTDSVLIGTAAGNKVMTAGNLAKGLPALLSSEEFISSLKMGELSQMTGLTADDNILIGTAAGNKYMKAGDALFAMMDAFGPPEIHRNVFGGRNLGTSVTEAQKAAIRDGSFKGLFVGDYWVINDVTWRIADIDYFLRCGDTDFTSHHLVIVPDTALYNAQMNETNITTGGYVGSKMYTDNLTQAKNTINSAFPGLVLTHKDFLTNAVVEGHPSAAAWVESTVELMNEIMVYGTSVFTPANNGVTIPYIYTTGKQQFALFALDPKKVNIRVHYWLRDVVSATYFASVGNVGRAYSSGATYSYGVRPYFIIG